MRRLHPFRILLGLLGLGIGFLAVSSLREATLSTHDEEVGREMELVVSAKTKDPERSQTLPEMVEAQILACRLEVNSDISGPIEALGDGRFRMILTPAMDDTDRRQFRGCVEDWIVDHLQVNVIELESRR